MASPFQRQTVQRKLVYFGLIVVLFTVTLVLRRSSWGMDAQAKALEVREENLGEVALDSLALRLMLFGARGAVVCYLWFDAHEKQKVHEWNLVDQRVQMIVKLQPHFISPWMYQSWNLAYNVSVEFDRIRDKYFYIARGIELLAEGERQNRDNAEMRYYIGHTQQGKMGISDENNTLRSLYQLSCIDPRERHPARFRNDRDEINWAEFEDFCKKHPHLVRRLREKLTYKRPGDIIDFLAANYKIPSRYEYPTPGDEQNPARLKPLAERFPIMPPRSHFGGSRELYEDAMNASDLPDDTDNYAVARAWYSYAQDPLDLVDRTKRKVRWGMAEPIFRGYPARAQCYIAERRQQEGWFDEEGWEITDWFPQSYSDPEGPRQSLAVGQGRRWAAEAWERTHEMYRAHGEKSGLYKPAEEVRNMTPEQLTDYNRDRHITNFDHFYFKSMVEQSSEAITARKLFYKANELYKQAEIERCLVLYEDPRALGPPSSWPKDTATGWKRIFLKHPDFRRDLDVQEEAYGIQTDYFRALYRDRTRLLRAAVLLQDTLALLPAAPTLGAVRALQHLDRPLPPPAIKGPFDDVDDQGQPLISPDAIELVHTRKGLPPPTLGGRTTPAPSPSPETPVR
jgi:hypothetical protein